MRKLVVSVLTSLDGYYEGAGRSLAGMPFEDAFNTHNLTLLRSASTMVYGSTWFANNWTHWSGVAADPAQNERDHEIARRVLAMDTLIVSDSVTISSDDPWAATSRVVPRAQAISEIARLKQGPGDDLLMFGSSTTWGPLLEAGVVDELHVLVGAALLGEGSKVYGGSRAELTLIGAQVLAGSQLVDLHYRAAGRQG